jgi:hypothetical protein
MSKRLGRYMDSCYRSTKRFKSKKRRARYCGGVAWKRARLSGRYSDYPAFKKKTQENKAMAKSRRKSRIARRRKRSAGGQFVAGAKSPARKKRRSHARAAASRRRARHAHAAAPRRRRRRAAAPTAATPKRRRRSRVRAKARARARARATAKNWPLDRAGHSRAAKKGWRRKKRRSTARNWPLDHAGHSRAARKGWRRKRRARASDWPGDSAGHRRAYRKGRRRFVAKIRARKCGPRRGRSRIVYKTKYRTRTKIQYRERKARRPRKLSHRMMVHPGTRGHRKSVASEYTLSNPLSAGELVLVAITGGVGYALADFVGRYMETTAVPSGSPANSIPQGATVSNDIAVTGGPTWQSAAAQLAVAAVPGVAAAVVDSPWAKAALQGMMLGAGFSLFGNVWKWAMANMLSGQALGQQLYLAEIEAQQAIAAAGGSTSTGTAAASTATAAPVTTAPTGMQGLPRGVGSHPLLRGRPGMGQQPPTMAAMPLPVTTAPGATGGPGGVAPGLAMPGGAPPSALIPRNGGPKGTDQATGLKVPPGILTNTGDVIPSAPPGSAISGGADPGPECEACPPTADAEDLARRAINNDSSLNGLPRGGRLGLYATFPD